MKLKESRQGGNLAAAERAGERAQPSTQLNSTTLEGQSQVEGEEVPAQIRDEGRGYFTQVLNCLWIPSLGLTYHDRELYSFYKKIAWEDGVCWIGERKIAQLTGLSGGQIRKSRARLAEVGLIRWWKAKYNGEGWPVVHVVIEDFWERNIFLCKAEKANRAPYAQNCAPHAQSRAPGEHKEDVEEDIKEEQRGGAQAPLTLGHPPESQPKKRKPHVPICYSPPVECARAVLGVLPNKLQMTLIDQTVSGNGHNLELWKTCVEAWRASGYRPTNIKGIVDWFLAGGPPEYAKVKAKAGAAGTSAVPIVPGAPTARRAVGGDYSGYWDKRREAGEKRWAALPAEEWDEAPD